MHLGFCPRPTMLQSASLVLSGQVLHIATTVLHAGGDANSHHAIFAVYALSTNWETVHLAQFVAMAILLAGLHALCGDLEGLGAGRLPSRAGAVGAVVSISLYGVLQAVDGVALKQSVMAWSSAPETERLTRFAAAETVRWLEWGLRSYQNVAFGLTVLLVAVAAAGTAGLPRPIVVLMALSGLASLVQGFLAGTEGFTRDHSIAIVLGWIVSLSWMISLLISTLFYGLPAITRIRN